MKHGKCAAMLMALLLTLTALTPAASAAPTTPILAHVPQNYSWPEGGVATYFCKAQEDDWGEIYQYEWYLEINGQTFDLEGDNEDWRKFAPGLNTGVYNHNTVTLDGVEAELNGAEIYCIVYSPSAWVETPHAIITVGAQDMRSAPEIVAPITEYCRQDEKITLSVDATSRSGGTDALSYQWYRTGTGRLQEIQAIVGANSRSYQPSFDDWSTFYYVCGVFDGVGTAYANYSYSNVIRVEVEAPPETIGLEILQKPTKTEYEIGQAPDLAGLRVRVTTSDGFFDAYNGEGLTVSPASFTQAGTQKVTVSYDGESASFEVTVKPGELAAPVITDQPVGGSFEFGQGAALEVGAAAEPGATLYFQWYECPDGTIDSARELPGATVSDYTAPETAGTHYYVCYVYACRDGVTSAGVPTDVVAITYPETNGEPTEATEPNGETAPTETAAETASEETAKSGKAKDDGNKLKIILIVSAVVLALAGAAVIGYAVTLAKKKKK